MSSWQEQNRLLTLLTVALMAGFNVVSAQWVPQGRHGSAFDHAPVAGDHESPSLSGTASFMLLIVAALISVRISSLVKGIGSPLSMPNATTFPVNTDTTTFPVDTAAAVRLISDLIAAHSGSAVDLFNAAVSVALGPLPRLILCMAMLVRMVMRCGGNGAARVRSSMLPLIGAYGAGLLMLLQRGAAPEVDLTLDNVGLVTATAQSLAWLVQRPRSRVRGLFLLLSVLAYPMQGASFFQLAAALTAFFQGRC